MKEFPFFEEAVEIEIMNVSPGKVDMYGEEIALRGPIEMFLVDKREFAKHKKGTIVRFKNAFNAKLSEVSEYGGRADFVSYSKSSSGLKTPIVSWTIDPVDVEVTMSDGSIRRGFSAPGVISAEGIIHLENIGCVNIDLKEGGKIKCVYGYK